MISLLEILILLFALFPAELLNHDELALVVISALVLSAAVAIWVHRVSLHTLLVLRMLWVRSQEAMGIFIATEFQILE